MPSTPFSATAIVPVGGRRSLLFGSLAALAALATGVTLDLGAWLLAARGSSLMPWVTLVGHLSWALVVGSLLAWLVGPLVRAKSWRAPASVEVGRGEVVVRLKRRFGLRTVRVRPGSVLGASTARLRGGRVSLALQLSGRPRPLCLELDDDRAAKEICRALDVGHGGFGWLEWPLRASTGERRLRAARLAGAAVLLVLAAWIDSGAVLAWLAVLIFGACAPFVLAHAGSAKRRDNGRVILQANGLALADRAEPLGRVSYGDLSRVTREPSALVLAASQRDGAPQALRLALGSDWGLAAGPTDDELTHVVAQIRGASARARGEGAPRPEHDEALESLKRAGEDARSYIARLDALASQLARGSSYRGGALDVADLWNALEDPDCDAEVRGAAARVLVRVAPSEAAERVDGFVASARDDRAKKRLRIALVDNADEAGAALDELIAEETPEARPPAVAGARDARLG